jgi:anthranilate synthase component 1
VKLAVAAWDLLSRRFSFFQLPGLSDVFRGPRRVAPRAKARPQRDGLFWFLDKELLMYHPSLTEVQALAEQGNIVPVWRELPADLETPVSVYLKLRGESPSFLLESVEKGEQVGRYSFLGVGPTGILTARDGRVLLQENGSVQQLDSTEGDPLAAAKEILSRYHPTAVNGLPRFCGGMVGYMSYDAARFFDRTPLAPRPGLGLPDAIFLLANSLVIFDHVSHRLLVVANAHIHDDPAAAYEAATQKIEAIVSRLRRPLSAEPMPVVSSPPSNSPPTGGGTSPSAPTGGRTSPLPQTVGETLPPPPRGEGRGGGWSSNFEQTDFEAAVREAKEYIAAGDIFQVVLSQRLSRRTKADSFTIYRALRMLNPSPYMFYLELPGELRLIGSSPEMLTRLDGRRAEVRPIAGTRPRGADLDEDEALAEELLADPKERAEHVMLVDLGRNDLGRVCRYGSVRVPEMMVVERYSHVMHIVSGVEGELRSDLDAFDLLRATFPAGTVSGAPKVRAMEIIAELEGEQRGPYAGAVGYFSHSGNMDTCIGIRTIVMQGDAVHVQAGAGIVADSDPTKEYHETLSKALALMEAVTTAEQGF